MPGTTVYLNQVNINSILFVATRYLALFTVAGTDAGTGFTEVSGGSYARASITLSEFNSNNAAPFVLANNAAISFPTATASWGNIVAFGIYDASTGGNLLFWDYLGFSDWWLFTCSAASPGKLFAPGITANSVPQLANTDNVQIQDVFGGKLPTGLSDSTVYTVNNLSSDTFDVGVDTTTTGSGMVRKVMNITVNSGFTFTFATGNLQLTFS